VSLTTPALKIPELLRTPACIAAGVVYERHYREAGVEYERHYRETRVVYERHYRETGVVYERHYRETEINITEFISSDKRHYRLK
jgi:hypothetical protein